MVLVRYEGVDKREGWASLVRLDHECLSSGDSILQTRGEAAVGIERSGVAGYNWRQRDTALDMDHGMGGACRVSWGERASFCDHWNTMG